MKAPDKTALALEVVRQMKPGYLIGSGAYNSGGQRDRETLTVKEQAVYDAALDVLAKSLKA